MITWRDGALKAGGRALEYACFGPAPSGGPVIVLLHEGLGSVSTWRDFPEDLAQATGLPVLAYSRAGYGQSDPVPLPRPLDYMTREAMLVLPEVLDVLGAEHVLLFGHSDGATIAAEFAGRVQDPRLIGLILMAPHFYHEPIGLQAIAAARTAYKTTNLRDKLARHHAHPDVAFLGWADSWLHPDQADWDVSAVIDRFQVPALMIQGTDDAYGTLRQIQEVEQRSPAAVQMCVLEGCGHQPQRERREEVLAAVQAFLAQIV